MPQVRQPELVEATLEAVGTDRLARVEALADLAGLRALEGDVEAGRRVAQELREVIDDLGLAALIAGPSEFLAEVERVAGEPARLVGPLTDAVQRLERAGLRAFLELQRAMLAWAQTEAGRLDDAAETLAVLQAQQAAEPSGDPFPDAWAAWARAAIAAADGRAVDAAGLAEGAIAYLDDSDFSSLRAEARIRAASYALAADRSEHARRRAAEGLRIAEEKGYRRGADLARSILADVATRRAASAS